MPQKEKTNNGVKTTPPPDQTLSQSDAKQQAQDAEAAAKELAKKKELEEQQSNAMTDAILNSKNESSGKDYFDDIVKAFFINTKENRDRDLDKSLQDESHIMGTQIVDVVSDYFWAVNKPLNFIKRQGNKTSLPTIPYLYAIQYKQKYGSSVSNLINSLNGINLLADKVNITKSLKGMVKKALSGINSAFEWVGLDNADGTGLIQSALDNISNYGSGHLDTGSGLLKPYRYLYSLQSTGKQFCFPYLEQGASAWNLINSFGGEQGGLLSKGLVNAITTVVQGASAIMSDIRDINNFIGGGTSGGFTMFGIEKAKAFSFPANGRTMDVSFPLYNTIENTYEQNYHFILLFALRNMLYRKSNVQYYPPMMYDVSVPGVGRMPLCYVSKFSVKPYGMTRMKKVSIPIVSISNDYTVTAIPQAWVVEIEFQSLIAQSGNQFLSSLIDLPIKYDNEIDRIV